MAEMAALNCSTSLLCLCSALLLDTFISAFVGPIEGRAELCSAIRVEIYFELSGLPPSLVMTDGVSHTVQ